MDDNPGPPVALYIEEHPETSLEIVCEGCGDTRAYPWPKVARRMLELRLNPVQVGVLTLGRIVTEPCLRCRDRKFRSRVRWPDEPPEVLSYAAAKKRS